ncbi:hemerythrin domain-containing protein [Piscinibacter sp. XHJ-5]|uniref:hemerythrin domain-containing protein n=1 Tax=Piscinibacter sp. XHJ-5 TaxID=3037797 RepID=UPI002452FAEE|nr:hemerythrin domain-containing protein [Piscinibacter sp. XHJ-5]
MERDVLQVLTEDHALLRWLGERLNAARPARVRINLFNEFARTLGAHQTVIDQTILPALRACGWRGLSSDVLAGHLALKRLLAETLTLDGDAPTFDYALRRIVARAQAHCEVEQRKLMPLLHAMLDDHQRELMAFDAEMHLTRLLGEQRRLGDDADLSPRADELVAEAYVVLGSLATRDEREQAQP